MSPRTIALRPAARLDIAEASEWNMEQGGKSLALQFVESAEAVLDHLARHSASGSPRYAAILRYPGLRCWPLKRFPYLIFYSESGEILDVWRVLHAERDIPAFLREETS